MADGPLGRLMEMPRNPARAPGPLEQLIADATVNPMWDMAKGVGAAASGYGNSPEAGAGLMAGIGMMGGPGRNIVQMLKGAGTNRQAFDQVLPQLEGLPKAQLQEIAEAYTGLSNFKGLSTEAIKKEIVKGFVRDARFEHKIAPTPPQPAPPKSGLMTSVDDAIGAIDAFLNAKKTK